VNKTKTKSERRVLPHNTWWCDTCNRKKQMTQAKMKEHLAKKHGLDGEIKGTRMMLSHVDAREWFSTESRWTFESKNGQVVAHQSVCCKRDKDDIMRYA
jgi:hypothetical protein